MAKKLACRYLAALLAFLSILSATPVLSFAAEENGIVGVKARYSSGIDPEKGDQFAISYENSDTGESGSISLDASEADGVYIDFEVPVGSYRITDVEYSGSNQKIVEQGYGVKRWFRVRDGEDAAVLYLYVGQTAVENLDRAYTDAVIKDSEHDENGNRTVFEDQYGKYGVETDENGNTYIQYLDEDSEGTSNDAVDDQEASSSDPGETGTSAENRQEPITEYYETDSDDQEDSHWLRNTVLIVLAVAAVVATAVFILRKKKIL